MKNAACLEILVVIPAAKVKYAGNTWNEEKCSDCWREWMVKQLYHPKFSFGIADLPVTQATKTGVSCCEQLSVSLFWGEKLACNMFMYLGKGWRRKEEDKLFSLQNFYTAQKMILEEVVVFAFFLDVCNLPWDMYRSVLPYFEAMFWSWKKWLKEQIIWTLQSLKLVTSEWTLE